MTRSTSHPKFLNIGLQATGLWTRTLSHCAAYLTDGHVSRATVNSIVGSPNLAEQLTVQLVGAGLWETHPSGDGWQVHDLPG